MPYASRKVSDGYPREMRFQSRAELDAYFSGHRITCLLCGGTYRVLDTHLRKVHSINSDDYRERYGIPYLRGLCGASFTEQRVAHGKRIWSENIERQTDALEKAKSTQLANGGNPQRRKPDFWKQERTKYTAADIAEFFRRVRTGRSKASVARDPDMPTVQHVRWWLLRNGLPKTDPAPVSALMGE